MILRTTYSILVQAIVKNVGPFTCLMVHLQTCGGITNRYCAIGAHYLPQLMSITLSLSSYFASLNREQINQSLTSSAVVDDVTVTPTAAGPNHGVVRPGVLWIRMCSPRWVVVSSCEICGNTSTTWPFKLSFLLFFIFKLVCLPVASVKSFPHESKVTKLKWGKSPTLMCQPRFVLRPHSPAAN